MTKDGENDGPREGGRNRRVEGVERKIGQTGANRKGRRKKAERTMDNRSGKDKQADREGKPAEKGGGQTIENGG